MNKYFLIVLLICLTNTSKAEEVIKLGVLAPLSGDFASYGEEIRRGTEIAVSKLKSKNINVDIIYENACLPIEYKTALNKLTSMDKINGISHSYCVIGMLPSMNFLEEKKIISFQSGAVKEILNPKEYLFSLSPKTTEEGKTLAQLINKNKEISDISVMYLETQWGIEFSNSLKDEWEKNGGTISLFSPSKIGETDFKSQALMIRKLNPKAIVLAHLGGMLGTIIKQIREIGYKGEIYSTSDSYDKNMFKSARGSEKGLIYLSTKSTNKTETEIQFEDAYKNQFNEEPTALSKEAFDSAVLIADSLSKCKLNTNCAKEKIYEIKNHQGASGNFSIDSDGGVNRGLEKEVIK